MLLKLFLLKIVGINLKLMLLKLFWMVSLSLYGNIRYFLYKVNLKIPVEELIKPKEKPEFYVLSDLSEIGLSETVIGKPDVISDVLIELLIVTSVYIITCLIIGIVKDIIVIQPDVYITTRITKMISFPTGKFDPGHKSRVYESSIDEIFNHSFPNLNPDLTHYTFSNLIYGPDWVYFIGPKIHGIGPSWWQIYCTWLGG